MVGGPALGPARHRRPVRRRGVPVAAIPDDRNAFVLYRQAAALFKRLKPSGTSPGLAVGVDTPWAKASPEIRRWAEANREALALYRRGADRPDALDAPTGTLGEYDRFQAVIPFQRLALLEASRLEDQGDMAGAWGWYRAYLRTLHHVSSHGAPYRRMAAQAWHTELLDRLEEMVCRPADNCRGIASGPRGRACVRGDRPFGIVRAQGLVSSDRSAYSTRGTLEPARCPPRGSCDSGPEEVPRGSVPIVTPEHFRAIASAWNAWRREPERSRRVLRLLMANRLAYYEMPPDRRPAPDPNVTACELYPFGPDAPANARVLSPESLGHWLESTVDPSDLVSLVESRGIRIREVANHHALVMLLATRLYRREHGPNRRRPRLSSVPTSNACRRNTRKRVGTR